MIWPPRKKRALWKTDPRDCGCVFPTTSRRRGSSGSPDAVCFYTVFPGLLCSGRVSSPAELREKFFIRRELSPFLEHLMVHAERTIVFAAACALPETSGHSKFYPQSSDYERHHHPSYGTSRDQLRALLVFASRLYFGDRAQPRGTNPPDFRAIAQFVARTTDGSLSHRGLIQTRLFRNACETHCLMLELKRSGTMSTAGRASSGTRKVGAGVA